MFDEIIKPENVRASHHKTLRAKHKFRGSAINFNREETRNLAKLVKELDSGTYRPSGYNSFKVYEPKERLIYAPKYRDKIVQHMVNNVLRDFYEPKFIHDSYSCIRGKGNQRAIRRIHHFTKKVQWQSESRPYLCKVDLAKFFYSINHQVLKDTIAKKVTCDRTLNLVNILIDHSPESVGLPLGNLCSQLFANILMNEADQFAKRQLKCRNYIRYADDIFILCRNKTQAQRYLDDMKMFLTFQLDLSPHLEKSFVTPADNGFTALGYRVYPTHILLSSQNKRRIKRRASRGELSRDSFQSWLSFANEAKCQRFIASLGELPA